MIPTPVSEILLAPLVERFPLIVSNPPAVIEIGLVIVPAVTGPVIVSAFVSLMVSAPPRVIDVIVPKSFPALPRLILFVVLAVNVLAAILVFAVCVTAPEISATPNVNVPELAVILPSITVVALRIVNADDVALVVVIEPEKLAAPPPALIVIVPVPDCRADAAA